ncbi:MAG: hypothetical protein ACOYL6_08940 [Bacteriovoracaceae bacterium]
MAFKDDGTNLTEDQILSFIPGFTVEASANGFSYFGKAAYRFDTFDKKRDLLYLGENVARWQNEAATHSFGVGFQRLQLGALEIFQSIDSINDLVSDSFSPEIQRQGYPVVNYKLIQESFKAELYYLPYFIAPYYPPNSSRLGYGIQFDQEQIVNADGLKGKEGFRTDQFGGKIDIPTEKVDITLGHFHFIDRGLSITALDLNNRLTRYFYATDFSFLTLQTIQGDYLFKSNLYHKSYHGVDVLARDLSTGGTVLRGPEDHTVASLGLETKLPLFSTQDTTLLLEGQRMFGVDKVIGRRYSVFSNDAAWGIRHQFNDVRNKQITLGHIIDLERTQEQIFQVDYRQYITDSTKVNIGVRIIEAGTDNRAFTFDSLAGLAIVDDADSAYLTMTHYF